MKVGLNARLDVFFKEFPFLSRYVQKAKISNVPKVKRIDLDFLDCSTKPFFTIISRVHILLIGERDEELCEVKSGETLHVSGKFWRPSTWGGEEIKIPGETVGDAIQKLSDPNALKYALVVEYRVDGKCWVTIYKTPTGYKFSDWLKKLGELAHQELSKNIAEIDNVNIAEN